MTKLKLLIGRACRSDYPLTDYIIKKLRNEEWCDYHIIKLIPADFLNSYKKAQRYFNRTSYDLILIPGDRIEVMALSLCAFLNNQKVVHLGSGIINEKITTFDDVLRHCTCLFSEIQLCEDTSSLERSNKLLEIIKKQPNGYVVGNPYLDGINDIDESLVPDYEYDLVLLNPTTTIEEEWGLAYIGQHERKIIFIQPNPDSIEFLKDFNDRVMGKGMVIEWEVFYNTLPRPQFLGLMKRCTKFYTNSSAAYYEAPAVGLRSDQIVMIGARNKNRSTPQFFQNGAADRIISILKKYWEGQK